MKFFFTHLSTFFYFFAFPVLANQSSLYNGAERTLSAKDRNRVLTILDTMGVDYELSGGKILVSEDTRESVQDLVATSLSQSLGVATPPSKSPTSNKERPATTLVDPLSEL